MRRSLRSLTSHRAFSITTGSFLVLALGAGSCSSAEDGQSRVNDSELQALLHDGKLPSFSILAANAPPPPPMGGAGGPITPADAGPPGAGGGVVDADRIEPDATSTTTGAGGSFGTGGAGGSFGAGGVGGSFGTGGSSTGTAGSFSTGAGGSSFDGGPPFRLRPTGQWDFEFCSPERTELFDSGPNGHTAFRSVSVACAEGIEGQGLAFASTKDIAYVPDQPDFTFDQGVTVAAWVNPDRVDDTRTIFRKRLTETSSFVLLVHQGKFRFVALLKSGRAVTVASKAVPNTWTHVAATYDNQTLRLFINGKEADKFNVQGVISTGEGPLLMGNDILERRLVGKLDSVVFDTQPMSASEIAALTCIRHPATVVANPMTSPPLPPGTSFTYDLSVTSHDSESCPARSYFFQQPFVPGFSISAQPFFVTVPTGGSASVSMAVQSPIDAEPDTFHLPFIFFPAGGFNDDSDFVRGEVQYVVAEPAGCHVSSSHELMIRDTGVVDDPMRTTFNGDPKDPRTGAWTFGKLIENLSPTPEDAPTIAEEMLNTWLADQTVNGFNVFARPAMRDIVLNQFPRTPDGKLDLHHAPLQLLAIVNRFDLNLTEGNAGEGRFVFGVLSNGFPLEFTFILEYKLPAKNAQEVQRWADDWHALSGHPFASEEYKVALQKLTDRFAGRNVDPSRTNGSGILQIRSNEIALSFQWELRQFELSPATGHLIPTTLPLTPDLSFNFTPTLGDFINANEAAIIAETHVVPEQLNGQPFRAGSVFNSLQPWFGQGVNDNEARFHLSLNTCNGCHSSETNTSFLQVGRRFPGGPAPLSPFLTGTVACDPVTREPRALNELNRRNRILHTRVCPDVPPPPEPTPPIGACGFGPPPDGGVGGSFPSSDGGGGQGGSGGGFTRDAGFGGVTTGAGGASGPGGPGGGSPK